MVSRVVKIGNHSVGGGHFSVIAGPCSIESEDQLLETSKGVKSLGAHVLRGGIYKLRTKPDTFQGLGSAAYELVKKAKKETGLGFVSEVTDPRQIGDLYSVVDAFQVGSRNMHNYELLKELGGTDKPIILKRGFSGLIKEWLHASEYITKNGNQDVILCERGIRTFESATRNTMDLNAIALLKEQTDLPIIADPSHGTGKTSLVTPLALASAMAGADGIMVEVHPNPAEAKSDGFQALNFSEFETLMKKLSQLMPIVGKTMDV